MRGQIETHREYVELLKIRPQNVTIMVRHMKKKPRFYDDDKFPEWPRSGCYCLSMLMPSQNMKVTAKSCYKCVYLFLSNEPNSKLGLPEELSQLYGWKCTNTRGKSCTCDRQAGNQQLLSVILSL